MAAALVMISPPCSMSVLVIVLLPFGIPWQLLALSLFEWIFPASHLQQDWLEILCTCLPSPSAGLLISHSV